MKKNFGEKQKKKRRKQCVKVSAPGKVCVAIETIPRKWVNKLCFLLFYFLSSCFKNYRYGIVVTLYGLNEYSHIQKYNSVNILNKRKMNTI